MPSFTDNVFQGIGGSIDNALATFVSSISAQLIRGITPWAIAGVMLYFTLYGYLLMVGRVQQPFSDFLMKCAKILVVGSLALNTDTYLTWIVEGFSSLEDALTATLSNNHIGTTLYASLDATLAKGFEVISACLEMAKSAGWRHIGAMFGWYINAILIAAGFAFVVVVGGVSILVSHSMIKVAFAVGPLFIICMIWPMMARFFDYWLHFVLNHILVVVLTSMMLSISVTVYGDELDKLKISDASLNISRASLELLIIAVALYGVMKGVMAMAIRLAGGFSFQFQPASRIAETAKQGALWTASKVGDTAIRLVKRAVARAGKSSSHFSSGQNRGTAPLSGSLYSGGSKPAYRQATLDYLQKRSGF